MRSTALLSGAAILTLAAAPSAGETLRDALAQAYATNPTLSAERANVRAVDENAPLARARALPSLSSELGYTENLVSDANIRNNYAAPDRQVNGAINLNVPILANVGGAVRAADKRIEAARAGLRGTEADLFTAVVGAYMDVIRDDTIVSMNLQNVAMLEEMQTANKERYEVGELNSTDLAQSRARLALGQSQLETAQARLIASRENYVRLVGVAPGLLETPPALPDMPADPDSAVALALANNPTLLSAAREREASADDISAARAQRLPTLSATASGNYYDYLDTLGSGIVPQTDQTGKSVSVGVALRVPIYQGGQASAQIRQANARRSQAVDKAVEVERQVIAETRSAFAMWRSAQSVIRSANAGVAANRESLEGVRAENQVGTRTMLDVLNAQQELLNSRVTLVTAERDAYVAGFALLAAMGRAEARDLGLDGGALYDPKVNYDQVRRHWRDLATGGTAPAGTGTSTANVPAQQADPRLPLDPDLILRP